MCFTKRLWIELLILLLLIFPLSFYLWVHPAFDQWNSFNVITILSVDFTLIGLWYLLVYYTRTHKINWQVLGIFTLWLMMHAGAWVLCYYSYLQSYKQAQIEFKNDANIIFKNLEERFKNPIYGLNGVKGVFIANPKTNAHQFRDYVLSRNLAAEFYNIRGFGIIEKVERQNYFKFEQEQIHSQGQDFKIKGVDNQKSLYIIKYIQPLETNRAAWGFDVGSEAMRRTAIEKSISLRTPVLTSMIHLVQDSLKRPAYLLYNPIYRGEQLLGVAYSPFVLEDLLKNIAMNLDEHVDFELFSEGYPDQKHMVFDLDGHLKNDLPIGEKYHQRMFVQDTILQVFQQKFLCKFSSLPKFENSMDIQRTLFLFFLVEMVSLLTIGFIIHLMQTKARISERAAELSEGLLEAKENAEQALSENQDLLHALNQFANVVILDNKTQIHQVNMKFVELSGYGPLELLHQSYRLLSTESSDLEFWIKIEKQILEGRIWRGDFHAKKKTGEPYWTDTIIVPLKDEYSKIYRYIILQRDLTPLKFKEQQLLELNRKLENQTTLAQSLAESAQTATMAKSMFLANMSHEIRTPMNGILGMIELLLDSGLNEEQRSQAEIVRNSSELLLALINDILDYSKIESGKMELEKITFDLYQALNESYALLHVKAQEKSITLNLSIDLNTPRLIEGDPTRLRQVLNNLVGNAIKFTSKGSVDIHVGVDKHAETGMILCFKVRDSGIGIPENKINQLFESFSQVDTSITRKFGGTGLGLAISKQLVELMGGNIHVESIEGRGSIFSFTIQVLSMLDAKPLVTTQSEIALIEINTGARILLAEDNLVNQKVAVGMLGKYGCKNVDVVSNGSEALEALGKNTYDLVFMDMQMPIMDGIEATQKIRTEQLAEWASIPIIAMTANAMKHDQELCIKVGMNDYISKPIDRAELLQLLQKWLPAE